MRAAKIAALSACLLVAAAGGAGAEPPGQGPPGRAAVRNVLTGYLDRANFHPPARLGRLTVFPITLSSANRLPRLLTMAEALAANLLVIDELERPDVERARFTSKSETHMIFLMSGEVITGGKQHRTLASDALLGPGSAVVLPLYCVQKGRWRGAGSFAGASGIAPQAVRAQAAQGAGQKAIWAEVARANRRLGSSDASEDLAAAVLMPENARRFAELRKHIAPKLPADCAGVVVAWGASIVGADLFNSPELFGKMRRRVLDSYLAQYGREDLHVGGRMPLPVAPPTQQEVRSYLQACYRASFTPGPQRGEGRIYHLSGARQGYTLAYAGRVVPVAADRAIERGREYMVHTALMEGVVPVRPRLLPMPRPTPER